MTSPSDSDASYARLERKADTTHSVPAKPDHGESSASTLIEAPLKQRNPLDPHSFPDGGGSGGAEAYRRRPRRLKARSYDPPVEPKP